MKRILAFISISCGLGLASWGVGGCGSSVQTTTDDGFPLLGGSYRLVGDVSDECLTLFGDRIGIGIDQTSNQLTVGIANIDTFETILRCEGTTDKNAKIQFAGTTESGQDIECSSTAIIEGVDNEDITLPLTCTVDGTTCEATYSN
ncbi:MAG TPA: hypothetical protein VFX30_14565 [bacterium]|nr:hypothetical protein [bacterium]